MRTFRGSLAQAAMAQGDTDSGPQGPLYIINLCASNTPMTLEAPDLPELGGFAIFRSRRVEDGRDRYRLHLGFFDSQEQAEQFLPLVRERYPAAWVALAPEDSMGSLDDTNVAQFRFIPKRDGAPAGAEANKAAAKTPVPGTDVATGKAASNAVTQPAEEFLKPEEVLSLLESPPPPVAQPAADAPARKSVARVKASAVQSFAVQLIWSTQRPDTRKIPRLAIFDAYTMYTVTLKRNGRIWYGLRLGFFKDPVSARQVALYVRSDYGAAAVVPVSERECERANEAARLALQKEAEARQRVQKTTVAPAKAPAQPAARTAPSAAPSNELAAAQSELRRALATLESDPKPASVKSGVKVAGRNGAAKRRNKDITTEELMEELGAHELGFQDEGPDALSDTGVRHLSVAVVKRRKGLGGLFSRLSGKA